MCRPVSRSRTTNVPTRTLSSLCRCVDANSSISARLGRESPCYGGILGRPCVATVRATVALQVSMLRSWALTWAAGIAPCHAVSWSRMEIVSREVFVNAALLRGCELFNFCTFWARVPLLRKDSGPHLRGDNSRQCGPAGVYAGILGADTGPLESLRAMQFCVPKQHSAQVSPKCTFASLCRCVIRAISDFDPAQQPTRKSHKLNRRIGMKELRTLLGICCCVGLWFRGLRRRQPTELPNSKP